MLKRCQQLSENYETNYMALHTFNPHINHLQSFKMTSQKCQKRCVHKIPMVNVDGQTTSQIDGRTETCMSTSQILKHVHQKVHIIIFLFFEGGGDLKTNMAQFLMIYVRKWITILSFFSTNYNKFANAWNSEVDWKKSMKKKQMSLIESVYTLHVMGTYKSYQWGAASANSVKFHGIRPRMYIEDLLWNAGDNVTLTSQKPCKLNNKCDCNKTKGYKWSLYFFNIEKYINFIYSADLIFRIIRIINFNRAEPTCYITNFPYASSG